MDIVEQKAIIEAILFASGKEVEITTLMSALELSRKEIEVILGQMRLEYQEKNHGLEIIKINNCYQMCTKKEYYDYIYPLFDNRAKPNLSSAAMETLSIIAYNEKITRIEIDNIRGVSTDGVLYKLMDYGLIEEAGKLDAPGRPTTYRVTNEFLKTFGISSLDELPELPKIREEKYEQLEIEGIENKEELAPEQEASEIENKEELAPEQEASEIENKEELALEQETSETEIKEDIAPEQEASATDNQKEIGEKKDE